MNYLDWISKWSSYTPHKKAVYSLDTKKSYTYKELHEAALKLESILKSKFSLGKGERLAILAEHSPEYLILFIATQRLGVILVPLNYRCTNFELLHCLEDVTPSLFVSDIQRFGELSRSICENGEMRHISLEALFQLSEDKEIENKSPHFEIDIDQPVFIFYTSGTTGKPKGVIYTNRMLFWNSLNTAVQLEITSSDHTLNSLPPYHTSGWNVLLLPMLHRGARVDFCKRFKPGKVLRYIKEQPISLFLAVPTMLKMMANTSAFSEFTPNKLKYMVVGGEPLSAEIIDLWAQKGILIRQGYGLTEAGPCITSLHHHEALWKKGSIGKPNFYVETKIVDEHNEEVGDGKAGELLLKGQIVTPGYWNNNPYTLEKIKDEWFYTGDIVKRDEEGFMYVLGRKSQIYISGGENIHPSEIERVLNKIPEVIESAVIGIEDKNWGEAGVAFLVSRKEKPAGEIMIFLSQFLAPFKVPKEIIYLDNLPKSGLGKTDRNKLREIYKNFNNEKSTMG